MERERKEAEKLAQQQPQQSPPKPAAVTPATEAVEAGQTPAPAEDQVTEATVNNQTPPVEGDAVPEEQKEGDVNGVSEVCFHILRFMRNQG